MKKLVYFLFISLIGVCSGYSAIIAPKPGNTLSLTNITRIDAGVYYGDGSHLSGLGTNGGGTAAVVYGITSSSAYRGDWGDAVSNNIINWSKYTANSSVNLASNGIYNISSLNSGNTTVTGTFLHTVNHAGGIAGDGLSNPCFNSDSGTWNPVNYWLSDNFYAGGGYWSPTNGSAGAAYYPGNKGLYMIMYGLNPQTSTNTTSWVKMRLAQAAHDSSGNRITNYVANLQLYYVTSVPTAYMDSGTQIILCGDNDLYFEYGYNRFWLEGNSYPNSMNYTVWIKILYLSGFY